MPARLTTALVILAALLASCPKPPPEAYVLGTARAGGAGAVSIGSNAAGEACTEQSGGAAQLDIFCGTWVQTSAHIARGAPASDLVTVATTSPWRTGLDQRFNCGPPTTTSILSGSPAAVMQCTRRVGGWPQVAVVANVGGTIYYGDGVLPALPVIERGIGVLSGQIQPGCCVRLADEYAVCRPACRPGVPFRRYWSIR